MARRLLVYSVLAVCLGGILFLPGCLAGGRRGAIDELFISNHRFNIDETAGVVRIYGRLDNLDEGHFAAIDVYATLRSTSGDSRGENKVELKNIMPHEQRPFALVVTSHDRVADVELTVRNPGSS